MITSIRFRAEDDLVILEVEEHTPYHSGIGGSQKWRDAKVEDLIDVARFVKDQHEIVDLESRVGWLEMNAKIREESIHG